MGAGGRVGGTSLGQNCESNQNTKNNWVVLWEGWGDGVDLKTYFWGGEGGGFAKLYDYIRKKDLWTTKPKLDECGGKAMGWVVPP